VYGKEKGDSGTPHLQGFIIFPKNKTLAALKKIDSSAHWEAAKASSPVAADYCKKGSQSHSEWEEHRTSGPNFGLDADVYESGKCPSVGKRTDLVSFQDAVKEGELTLKRLREDFPEVTAKYPRYVEQYIRDHMPRPEVPMHVPTPWQQELLTLLKGDISDRKIICCIDPKGEAGKSWFCDYYEKMFENSYLCNPGKHTDMVYAFYSTCSSPRVIFIDVSMSRQDKDNRLILPYEFMEHAKNGRMTNTKYTSETFYFKRPHVVLFANQFPDEDKMAQNRFIFVDCSKQH